MKKRKPWYRLRNVVLVALVAGLIWLGWAVYFAMTAKPGNAIDYAAKLNELARVNQQGDIDAPNRWIEYNEVLLEFDTLVRNCDWSDTRALGQQPGFAPIYDGNQFGTREDAALARQESLACLEEIRASDVWMRMESVLQSGLLYRVYDNTELPFFVAMPDISVVRSFARSLRAEIHVALDEGRPRDAIRAIRLGLAMAQASHDSVNLITWLVGHAQCHILLDGIRAEALAGRWSTEEMHELLGLVGQFKPRFAELALEGERLAVLDIIQRVYSDNGNGNGRFLLAEFLSLDIEQLTQDMHPIVNVTGFVLPDKRSSTANVNAIYGEAIRQAAMLPAERRAQQSIESFMDSSLGKFDFMVGILCAAFDRAVGSGELLHTELDGTKLVLAIGMYHAEHGGYPASLEELVPEFLSELPVDRWAPDGKYRYIRRSPTDDDPREYLLYSVGYDETDNNANDAEGHYGFDKHHRGTDHVINRLQFDKFAAQ